MAENPDVVELYRYNLMPNSTNPDQLDVGDRIRVYLISIGLDVPVREGIVLEPNDKKKSHTELREVPALRMRVYAKGIAREKCVKPLEAPYITKYGYETIGFMERLPASKDS